MPLVVSRDFTALEAGLFRRIDAVKGKDPLLPIAVVAPSGRILARLRRRILESGRAWLQIHLLHHQGLADRILEAAPAPPLRAVGSDVLLPLLQAILGGRRRPGPLTRYALRYGGAAVALLGTFRDLRDAGVAPDRAAPVLTGSGDHEELVDLYARFCGAIDRLEETGRTDPAGVARRAAAESSRSTFLADLHALFHYGAYDLIQVHQDLLASIAERVPVTLMVPGVSGGPAFRFASRILGGPLARSLGGGRETAPPEEEPGLLADRLDRLYDEKGESAAPLPAGRVEVLTAAGERLELEAVARRALQAHAAGVPLHEIGIVARTLEPYAAHLEGVFDSFGLPFVTSASQPLLRYPGPLAFRKLIRVLDDDFPRTETADLLRSPALRLEAILGDGAPAPVDEWDLWSRQAGLRGGRRDWTGRLPDWARSEEERFAQSPDPDKDRDEADRDRRRRDLRRRIDECDRLARCVAALADGAGEWSKCRTWSEHSRLLRHLAGRWLQRFTEREGRGLRELGGILDGLVAQEAAERAAGGTAAVSRGQARLRLESLLAEAVIRETSTADEGVAVLDAMQARGESFRVLFLIGLSSDQWPRKIHPDPFLPDPDRRRLEAELGLQVPVKETARDEDRLLLALLLGAARERLVLSYQRADDAGRARAHSTVWREIARLVAGVPEAGALLERGESLRVVPTDPARRAEFELRTGAGGSGFLTPGEGAILAAGAAADPIDGLLAGMERIGRVGPALRRGADYIRAVNRWGGEELERDGRVGRVLPTPEYLSASRVENFGKCPLQYFFRYGLGIEELEDPEEEDWFDPGRVGIATHKVLERIYLELKKKGRFPIRDPAKVIAEAIGRLREFAPAELAPLREPVAARFPLLWSTWEAGWFDALESFLRFDLSELAAAGGVPARFEFEIREKPEIPVEGGSRAIGLQGIVDRIDEMPDNGLRVIDYKTARRLRERVSATCLVRGREAQMGIYLFLAREKFPDRTVTAARILGVGPNHPDPAADPAETAPQIEIPPDPADCGDWRRIGDAVRRLTDLLRDGIFPFRSQAPCDWCPYDPACRRNHPPTADRVASAEAFAALRALDARPPAGRRARKK